MLLFGGIVSLLYVIPAGTVAIGCAIGASVGILVRRAMGRRGWPTAVAVLTALIVLAVAATSYDG